LAIDN